MDTRGVAPVAMRRHSRLEYDGANNWSAWPPLSAAVFSSARPSRLFAAFGRESLTPLGTVAAARQRPSARYAHLVELATLRM